MPLTNAQRMAKWRVENPERVIEIRVNYYYSNKDEESKRQQKKYLYKKESERLRNILI